MKLTSWNQKPRLGQGELQDPRLSYNWEGAHGQGGVDMLNSWLTSALRGVTSIFQAKSIVKQRFANFKVCTRLLGESC